jgi:hypothetical protein
VLGGGGVGGMGGGGGGAVGRVAGGGECGEGGIGVDVGGVGGAGILSARALVNSLLLGGGSGGGGIEGVGAGKRGGCAAFSERGGGGGGLPTKEYTKETCTRSLLEHSRQRFSGGEGNLGASKTRGGLAGELGGGKGDADELRLSFRDLCPVNEGRVGGGGEGRDGGMTQTRWSAVHGGVGGVGVGGRVTSGQKLRKLFVAFDLCGSPSALRRHKF